MIFLFTDTASFGMNASLLKIREAAIAGADYILLRENHLNDEDYYNLALSSLQMLTGTKTELIICHRPAIADALNLKKHARFHERCMDSFSIATHSIEELMLLEPNQYGFYGNVFKTSCKPGVKPKSVEGLRYYKNAIALGGVNENTLIQLKGIVNHIGMMSSWLKQKEVKPLIQSLRREGY